METTGVNTYNVKVYYRACKEFTVKKEGSWKAHREAYNLFMDSSPKDTLDASTIDYSLVETSIEGDEASDMLHD